MLANVNFTYIKSPEMRPLRKWSKTPEKSQYMVKFSWNTLRELKIHSLLESGHNSCTTKGVSDVVGSELRKRNLTLHIFVSFTLALIWRCKRVLIANGASRLCKYAASKTGTSLYDLAEITNCHVVTLSPTSFCPVSARLSHTHTHICLATSANPNIILK